MEDHLLSALKFPADRISSRTSFLPSMRYITEFVQTYKFTVRPRLLGFTLNPEHVGDTVLKRVLRQVPKAEIIILKRRNLVKLAISGISSISSLYISYFTGVLMSL